MRHRLAALAVAATLSACAGHWLVQFEEVPQQYVVAAGDTLHQIAFRYRLDPRALAQWNGVGRDARIYAGQELRLRPPLPGQLHPVHGGAVVAGTREGRTPTPPPTTVARAPRPTAPPPGTGGKPASRPTPPPAIAKPLPPAPVAGNWRWPLQGQLLRGFGNGSDGIDIAAPAGSEVVAAAPGRVVYGGSALKGYGLLLILQHEGELMSAYAHTSELLVGEGDTVRAGQAIARSGLGPGQKPLLHFETRRSGRPVDPLGLLPRG